MDGSHHRGGVDLPPSEPFTGLLRGQVKFCQCYFNTKPAAHSTPGGHSHHGSAHFCRANLAYKINKGHFGKTTLDGAKFWVATDLYGDPSAPRRRPSTRGRSRPRERSR